MISAGTRPWRCQWALAVVFLWLAAVPSTWAQGPTLSEAIMIALAEAHRLYVVLEDYPVRIHVDDTNAARVRWQRKLAKDLDLARQLEGKTYWAVFIAPNPPPGSAMIGGPSIVVFVDRTSRAVFGHFRPGESD